MSYSVTEAAQAIGKSKATVLRAIQRGRVSAARDDITGAYRIEPVELHRLYPPTRHAGVHDAADDATRRADAAADLREMRARLDAAEAAIRFRDEMLADLRQQRDRVQEQLTAALRIADQRAPARPPVSAPEPPRSTWQRLMAWRRGP